MSEEVTPTTVDREALTDQGQPTSSLSMKNFLQALSAAGASMERTDGFIQTLETYFNDPDTLSKMKPMERLMLFEALIKNKQVSSTFMVQMTNLGIRAKFLEEFLTPTKEKPRVPRQTMEHKERRRVLQAAIDSKVI